MKRLTSFWKEMTILIILFSLFKQIIFYGNFKIPITHFMDWAELWMTIAGDAPYFLPIVIAILFALDYLEGHYSKEKILSTEIKNENKVKTKYIERIFAVMLTLLIFILIIYAIINKKFYEKVTLFAASGMAMGLLLMLKYNFFEKFSNLRFLYFNIVLLFMLVIQLSTTRSASVERGKYKGTTIITKTTTFISTDTDYYIGKTEKYIFFFHTADSSSDIIPMSDVERLIFKTK